MAFSTACPSCGAPVVFKSTASIFAVCEYCRSTLVRHDQELADIGKMAALAEDRSPLQLGSEGQYRGVHFALIGRIQIRYSQGLWNEWHLLFDDMRNGWLSEAAGEYVLTFVEPVMEPLPAFADLSIGQRLLVAGQAWTVSNLERAECVAGEGELPFKVGAGYPVDAVDLRNPRHFATLDYSETPALLFIGEAVELPALALANLRAGVPVPERVVDARVFRCPSCGSPLQARNAEILAVGCAACGAVVDIADPGHALLSQALATAAERYAPRLPLGSKGKFHGLPYEVIGFLVKRSKVDGIAYDWREYLLAGEGPQNQGSYRWLTEYNNHWNIVDVLSRPPASPGAMEVADISWDGDRFKHFSSTPLAEVIQVAGEFTWRVRRGECNRVVDYVAPPRLLSCESSASDLSWSQGSYAEPAAIAEAFGFPRPLPEPVGVYANQPNPWAETHRRTCSLFWKLALLACVLQAIFHFSASSQSLLREVYEFTPQNAAETRVSRDFQIAGKPRKLVVRSSTNLDNNWLALDLLLVDKASGAAWPAPRDIAYYHGYDDGYWAEGSSDDEVVFRNIPPGTYYLAVDASLAPEKPQPVRTTLEVSTDGAAWSNFILIMLFLAAFPVFSRIRHAAFEIQRWAESDHAPSGEDDD